MGLLKRLTNGLSRREEEPAKLQPAQPREPKLRQPAPEARRLTRRIRSSTRRGAANSMIMAARWRSSGPCRKKTS